MASRQHCPKRSASAFIGFAALLLSILALNGCRKTVTVPPPSLALPGPVRDLLAIRGDSTIWLTWTMPLTTTDNREIKGDITASVCRRDGISGICADAGKPLTLAPGASGSFSELLPPALSSGPARALYYFVKVENVNGKSAGLINRVATLAGASPSPVRDLTAVSEDDGVRLTWTPAPPGEEDGTVIRLFRTPLPSDPAPQPGPLFDVNGDSEQAVDQHIRNGESYEYRAQRVARVTVNGQVLELAGCSPRRCASMSRSTLHPRSPQRASPGRRSR